MHPEKLPVDDADDDTLANECKEALETNFCNKRTSISVELEAKEISLKSRTCEKKISYSSIPEVKNMIKDGYRPDKSWSLLGTKVGVLAFRKWEGSEYQSSQLQKVILVFVDISSLKILGHLRIKGKSGSDWIKHMEVFGCSLSKDNKVVGVVFAVVSDCKDGYETCECYVHIYDVTTWRLMQFFKCHDGIVPGIAFDPRSNSRMTVVGLRDGFSQLPTIKSYSLKTGCFLNSKELNLFDLNGESMLNVTYTQDGKHIILQVLEHMGYGNKILYMSYILSSDDFCLLERCSSNMAAMCHVECAPLVNPIFSNDGSSMSLLCQKAKGKMKIQNYSIPVSISMV